MKQNQIEYGEHVFIAGQTGTGKSYLAEYLLQGYQYVIMLDTKDQASERKKKGKNVWGYLKEGKDYTIIQHLSEINNVQTDKIVYVPSFDEQDKEHYDSLFRYVYERENTILWIDVLMSVCDSSRTYPLFLKALYTRGRSKNVSVVALTQRPVDIPQIATANSTHFYTFTLRNDVDREKMSAVTGCPELKITPSMVPPKSQYNFWYYRDGYERPILSRMKL